MDQDYTFDVKMEEETKIKFCKETTFENFIGQFQLFTTKILCIINGKTLYYYDKSGPFPSNIRFTYKQKHDEIVEYYFRHINNNISYCVFGRENAKIFYPNLDQVDHEEDTTIIKKRPICQKIDRPIIPLFRDNTNLTLPTGSIVKTTITQNLFSKPLNTLQIDNEQIIIIDKGKKLTFPNSNYPIEVRFYQ